jgi:hypothetical protein
LASDNLVKVLTCGVELFLLIRTRYDVLPPFVMYVSILAMFSTLIAEDKRKPPGIGHLLVIGRGGREATIRSA